ncbi:transmembrane protein 135-like [Adelges cooleyi]|uniref:transmembrane protein 135-like n=1 Tax=Adelges cooleyi TaxID=133065 RepID=UPI0021802D19|nr:transmembrane protein 135-like [Adelges cooleyi]XP_050429384.1 transmembrane protein 135-like [Adelges cooleyi]
MAVASKILKTIDTSCYEYMHPWVASCSDASAGLFIHSLQASFRIYVTTYMLTLLMKGRKPTKKELSQTFLSILQSTAFLTCHAFGFSSAVCILRRMLSNFNVLTVAFVPCFLTCLVAILIERPSRRGLLTLYVTNVASETFYNMMVSRGVIKPIPYGDLFIFGSAITLLLYFYRGQHNKADSIYSLLRFVVGPCEENDYSKPSVSSQPNLVNEYPNQNTIKKFIHDIHASYHTIDDQLKKIWINESCPHAHGCLHYITASGTRLFLIGYTLQLCLKSLLQVKRVIRKPTFVLKLMVTPDTFSLGAFLGGFSTIYRLVSCVSRRVLTKDSKYICIPAGLLASLTFCLYRNNTIALYVMLKSLQLIYNKGSNGRILPNLPQANVFIYCFSTAILFHAAILEPHNLRPSYWKFLQTVSGGCIGLIDRHCLDAFGLRSSESLEKVLLKHKPVPLQLIKF